MADTSRCVCVAARVSGPMRRGTGRRCLAVLLGLRWPASQAPTQGLKPLCVAAMAHGAWCMVHGAWCLVHGARCMVRGRHGTRCTEPVACGCRHSPCRASIGSRGLHMQPQPQLQLERTWPRALRCLAAAKRSTTPRGSQAQHHTWRQGTADNGG